MAWALKQRFDWGDAFLGYAYTKSQRPVEFQGMTRMVFATRKAAREFVKANSWWGSKPRVVKVEVILKEANC